LSIYAYNWGVTSLSKYLDDQLTRGRAYFTKEEAVAALGHSSETFSTAAMRLTRKGRLDSPKRGFYLILRPEDRVRQIPSAGLTR